jgi:hypothetical protein
LQDIFQEIQDALYIESFSVDDEMTVKECEIEEECHPPPAKEALEEHTHEESPQEDLNDEDLDETSVSMIPLDEDEVFQPYFPPAYKDEEVISPKDVDDFVEDFSDTVDQHINDFIQIRRCRWDVQFNFEKEPIYDIEGSSQEKRVELSSLE